MASWVAVTSDEGVTASMGWWRKRGHGGGRGVARSISISGSGCCGRKWEAGGPDGSGIDLLCSDRVRILDFVIRLM